MIAIKAHDMTERPLPQLFGGMVMSKGQVSIVRAGEGEALSVLGNEIRFLCGAEQTGKVWSLMETLIPRGAGAPPHHHPWDEAYYLLSGELDFQIGCETMRVGGGDFIYAPGGTPHAFFGVSDEPARMLIFDAPAHAETFFKDLGREVRKIPDDLPKLAALGGRHGVTFVHS